jgi:hypothetical protein
MGVRGCSKIGRDRDARNLILRRPGFYVDRRAFSRAFEMLDKKLKDDAFLKTYIYIYVYIYIYIFLNYFFKILLHT